MDDRSHVLQEQFKFLPRTRLGDAQIDALWGVRPGTAAHCNDIVSERGEPPDKVPTHEATGTKD